MQIRLVKTYRGYPVGTSVEVTQQLADRLVSSGVAVVDETAGKRPEVRRVEAAVAGPQDVRQAVQTR